jgi:Uncharacterized protein conserved in bacteria (DUF2188)
MPRLLRFDVVRDNRGGWRGEQGRGNTVIRAHTKADAVRQVIQLAKQQGADTIRIHFRNGLLLDELTYAPAGNPSRSRG